MTPPRLPLNDLFLRFDASPVRSVDDWTERRLEILEWMQREQYGFAPPAPGVIQAEILQEHHGYGSDRAGIRRSYRLWLDPVSNCSLILEVFRPQCQQPCPVLLTGDGCWPYLRESILQQALARGWMVARFNRLDLAPDWGDDAGRAGVRALGERGRACPAIAAWAWGYSRVVDFLLTLPEVDSRRIAISGHSRGGKTVLLAGAVDSRVAAVLPNNSGCGGAAPHRWRDAGSESLADILRVFPYWFSPSLKSWIGRESQMPLDQHALLACVAPRALLLTEGAADTWCNVGGTRLAFEAAREVWKLLRAEDRVQLHVRSGGHGHTEEDWARQMDFAERAFAAMA